MFWKKKKSSPFKDATFKDDIMNIQVLEIEGVEFMKVEDVIKFVKANDNGTGKYHSLIRSLVKMKNSKD